MAGSESRSEHRAPSGVRELDALIIGAGVSGIYALYRLRGMGLNVRVYDQAGDVGGTWWWNRYPGARVDYPGGPFYCYTFSEELVREWDWTERQPDQPSVLSYLHHVADKFDLRRDIQLRTKVQAARFDATQQRWFIETDAGERIRAQFLICAVGTLSAPNIPDIPGLDGFGGEVFHTGHWPQEKRVEFAGKRVGVVGTGSSGVQIIPHIAREAEHLTVFQRTPSSRFPRATRHSIPTSCARVGRTGRRCAGRSRSSAGPSPWCPPPVRPWRTRSSSASRSSRRPGRKVGWPFVSATGIFSPTRWPMATSRTSSERRSGRPYGIPRWPRS